MRSTTERRDDILNQVHCAGSVTVLELAETYGVSKVTIRNDLDTLEKKGLLVRSHGGALRKRQDFFESTNTFKNQKKVDEKEKIALAALSQIEDGDAIILSAGTTTEHIARKLVNIKDAFVVTNGLNILLALSNCAGVSAVGTGGNYHSDSMTFYGTLAEESISKYNLDKMIVGVDGLHAAFGVTTHSEHEARFYNAMLRATKKCIVVADSSKFERVSVHKIMPCSKIDVLITDSGINDEYKRYMIECGIELVIV
ncbi:DeoR/GlpR family DNA-binding transcription regulator [Vibrio mimicus]|uniref:DeoR/GlpR family DNA-binding transcription regulator n=1 Tax=Vibrio mimicus TaxID=674 RepID=UPI002F94C031